MSPPRPTTVPALATTVEWPLLSAQEAYTLLDVLDRLTQALWDAHGDAMLDIAAAEVPDCCCDDEPDYDIAF